MRKSRVVPLCAASLLTMAANDPAKFYQSMPHRTPDAPINEDPTFHPSSGDPKQDISAMETNGFEPIGYSAFNGKEAGRKAVSKQARQVGATDVVYIEKYTDTQSAGAIGSTSYSRWGAFSFVTPMSVRRYDQLAIYFRKAARHGFGAYGRSLTDGEKVALGSNKGVAIISVTNGSPAFMADVLPGDILVAIGDRSVWDPESLHLAIDAVAGKPGTIVIYRAGQRLTKTISIPAGDW